LLDLIAVRRAALLERRVLLERAAAEMAARARREQGRGQETAAGPARVAETDDGGAP
jgi:hypothetical protein